MTLTPEYLAELEAAIKELSGRREEGYPKDDMVLNAARTFHAIAPLLMEVIEARGRATEGEWRQFINGTQIGDKDAGGICAMWRMLPEMTEEENAEGKYNADFITTAANNIAKIEKVLRDG